MPAAFFISSSRKPWNEGCRSLPSLISGRYSTSARSCGFNHCAVGFRTGPGEWLVSRAQGPSAARKLRSLAVMKRCVLTAVVALTHSAHQKPLLENAASREILYLFCEIASGPDLLSESIDKREAQTFLWRQIQSDKIISPLALSVSGPSQAKPARLTRDSLWPLG